MCIDLYVDKVLVYSDCAPSPNVPSPYTPNSSTIPSPEPSPSIPSPAPSPEPSPSIPSPVPSLVPSPYTESSSPSTIPSPVMDAITDGYSLTTPSMVATTKTMMTPSSSNSSNMTDPFGGNEIIYIYDWTTPAAVIAATLLPAIFLCILAYKKKPKKCKKPNKVQPESLKKKPCCQCCKKEPLIPVKHTSTTTGTYINQPPLPTAPIPRETE